MIDAVVNSTSGPALVHDERDLEGAQAFLVDEGGRCAVLRADGTLRSLTRGLDDELREAFSSVEACHLIRMEGSRLRSFDSIRVAGGAR